ncbi:MAG: alpha/beta fold hydrolase [Promethearchaeota archaeon]
MERLNIDQIMEGYQNVGGFKLYFKRTINGSPTVIFDSGLGDDITSWEKIFPYIASRTSALVYDRAGIGKSDFSLYSRSAEQVAQELHTLLKELKINPPYILVGHSLGGWHIRVFAGLYPKEVCGLLLIDPQEISFYKEWKRMYPKHFEYEYQTWLEYFNNSPQGEKLEWEILKNRIEAPSNPTPTLVDVPTILITSIQKEELPTEEGFNPEIRKLKFEISSKWMSRLNKATNILKADVGHYIHKEDPALIRRLIDYLIDINRE